MESLLSEGIAKNLLPLAIYLLGFTCSTLIKMYFDIRKIKQDLNQAFRAIRRLEKDYGRYTENYRKIATRTDYGEICEKDDSSSTRCSSLSD